MSGDPGGGEISLVVNGEHRRVPAGTTLADLVGTFGVPARGVAVAVDREVVARSAWADVEMTEGARVEVVTAAPGG